MNSTQLEQGSAAVATGRHVLMSEGQGSCDVMEALGREVVVRYLGTLQDLELGSLVTELRVLRAKAEVSTCFKTRMSLLHLITRSCLSATLTLPVFMVYTQLYIFTVRRFAVHATSTTLASGKPVPDMEL